jgi:hypothetical protein
MKRFYGSAVFEGEEVADSAYTKLQDIRSEEQRRVEYHNREFEMQVDELNRWRSNEISAIRSDASRRINEQYNQRDHHYQNISVITSNMYFAIAAAKAKFFLQFHVPGTQAENAEIARIIADATSQIRDHHLHIQRCYSEIARINSNRIRLIAQVHRDYAIEYNIRLTRRDKDLAWTHADATDQIAAVFARRYNLPVFMLRCAKGPCEFCRAKYGTTGTREELEKLTCIPPFHDDCRCWLEEVGYVVMAH